MGRPGLRRDRGRWTYTVEAWSDPVATWRAHAAVKIPAGIDTGLVLLEGAELYERAGSRIPKRDGREAVMGAAAVMRDEDRPAAERYTAALDPAVDAAFARRPYRELVSAAKPLPSWSSASGPCSAPGTRCSRVPRERCWSPARHP